jgi:putative ABC transport system permease protein
VYLPRDGDVESDVSIPDVVDWRARLTTFEAVAAFAPGWSFDLVGDGEPERLVGAVAEADYFTVLRVRPLLGRVYTSADDRPGGAHVAVLSEGLWRRRFGADSAIVGRTVTLSDQPTEILGVVPATADVLGLGFDLYLPVAPATPWAMQSRGTNHLEAFGRMRPGVTLAQADAELQALTRALATEYPRTNGGKVIRPVDLRTFMVGGVRTALWVLLGATTLVLLITCVNLANFLLARAAGRRQELAVRRALGAGRRQLLGQLLAESLVLALPGAAIGVLVAMWGRDLLVSAASASLPRLESVHLDLPVLAFALLLAVAAGVGIGVLPAVEAWRGAPADALGTARGGSDRWRTRRLDALAAAQVALAIVLVVGAGLLVRSFDRLTRVPLGYDPAGVLVADVVLPQPRFAARDAQSRAFTAMVEEARAIPGVTAAAFVIGPPLNPSQIGHTVLMDDRPYTGDEDGLGARVRPVIGGYFAAMAIPIVQGRAFTAADNELAARVVVVNRRFAAEVWPGADPLGKRIAFRLGGDSLIWRTVVGVVGDVRSSSLAQGDARSVYLPYVQRDVDWESFGSLVLRAVVPPATLVRPLREAVWRVDPRLPLGAVAPLAETVARSVARERFSAAMLGAFAAAALLVAMQGIYSVLAYAVVLRRREIGIRVALGADRRQITALLLRRGLAAAGAGLLLGIAGALAGSRLLRTMLFETPPTDLGTFAASAALMLGVAAMASWLPARRASRLDPIEALRSE